MDTVEVVRAAISGRPAEVVDKVGEMVKARALEVVAAKYYPQPEQPAGDENLDTDGGDSEEA